MTLTASSQTTELSCGTREAAAACVDVLREVVYGLAPDGMLAAEAPEAWRCFDQVEKLGAAAKMLLARKVDESRIWEREGMRDAAEYLALRSGVTREAARNSLQVSARLPKLATVEAAVRQGELSAAQAHSIADAASEDPASEQRLLRYAKTACLKELRDECLRTKAAAAPDPEGRRRRIKKGRYFRHYTDAEGAWRFSGRGTVENGSVFTVALDLLIDQIFKVNHTNSKELEPREALAFDAVIQMARCTWAAAHGYTPDLPQDDTDDTSHIDGVSGTDDTAGTNDTSDGDNRPRSANSEDDGTSTDEDPVRVADTAEIADDGDELTTMDHDDQFGDNGDGAEDDSYRYQGMTGGDLFDELRDDGPDAYGDDVDDPYPYSWIGDEADFKADSDVPGMTVNVRDRDTADVAAAIGLTEATGSHLGRDPPG